MNNFRFAITHKLSKHIALCEKLPEGIKWKYAYSFFEHLSKSNFQYRYPEYMVRIERSLIANVRYGNIEAMKNPVQYYNAILSFSKLSR